MASPNSPREKFLDGLAEQAELAEGLTNAVDLILSNFLDHGETIHHGTKDAVVLRFLAEQSYTAAMRLREMIQKGTVHV